jgi:hypothetical protein
MTLPRLYPPAVLELVDYADEAGPIAATVLGWVEHLQAGNNDPFGVFEHATSPNRRFSHLWFGKLGQVRQYQYLDRASWAQGGGNTGYLSCETEGLPGEALTEKQLDALARWHVWCKAPDLIASRPGDLGIGTHGMGGSAWGGHPDCPGTVRAGQRAEILRRAKLLRGGGTVPLTNDDADTLWERPYRYGAEKTTPLDMLREVFNVVHALQLEVTQLRALVAQKPPAGS